MGDTHVRRRKTRTRMANFREVKLIRDRESKRIIRRQYIADCSALKDELAELTGRLRALQNARTSVSSLPWHEVATSMSEAMEESLSESKRLQVHMARAKLVSDRLVQWMQSSVALDLVECESANDIRKCDLPWKQST
ncbi:hypothetical protein H257_07462 [Aphanomyces astaci]|uniref:Uncharacterized protein n=1 Tax=Aphanomyces astaci TaxID=112090 RepID=W4GJF0_APHAT|nr:hypothetical protein H257_07462 [Aphanomyces astaci]ETV79461.1 hypothetical protein H257_07462 [Aphanomyces astaci]|eukprot:XP_009831302.1 hypothetical protein H257_07462 [Aphanomyces astaci]